MSPVPDPITIQVDLEPEILVTVQQADPIDTQVQGPVVPIIAAANVGPQGPPGQWTKMTQAEFDALPVKDPDTLYVIVG